MPLEISQGSIIINPKILTKQNQKNTPTPTTWTVIIHQDHILTIIFHIHLIIIYTYHMCRKSLKSIRYVIWDASKREPLQLVFTVFVHLSYEEKVLFHHLTSSYLHMAEYSQWYDRPDSFIDFLSLLNRIKGFKITAKPKKRSFVLTTQKTAI